MSNNPVSDIINDTISFRHTYFQTQIKFMRHEFKTNPRINTLIENAIVEIFQSKLKEIVDQTNPLLDNTKRIGDDITRKAHEYEIESTHDIQCNIDALSKEIETLSNTRKKLLVEIDKARVSANNAYVKNTGHLAISAAELYRDTVKNSLVDAIPTLRQECCDKITELKTKYTSGERLKKMV